MNEQRLIEKIQQLVPGYMVDSTVAYVLEGQRPGGFLTAVMENKLYEAACKGDHTNRLYLLNWATLLESLPGGCWGSSYKVDKWMAAGGLRGVTKTMMEQTDGN